MIEFEVFDADRATRFELVGRLDSAGVEHIESPLMDSLRKGTTNVLFDLSRVPFVGSLGIRLLISAARALQRQGRGFALFGAQRQVDEVFETVALGDMIPIAASETEAAQLLGH